MFNTQKAATHYRINQEIKFQYLKKARFNEQLYKKHLECAATWPRIWTSIQQIIDSNLQGEMEQHYTSLNKKLDKLNNSYPQRTRQATRGHTQEFYPRTIISTSVIKLVNLYSNIKMMHGPIRKTLTDWSIIIEVQNVYRAVSAQSLHKTKKNYYYFKELKYVTVKFSSLLEDVCST